MQEKAATFEGDPCYEKNVHSNSFQAYRRFTPKRNTTNAARATGEAAQKAIKVEEGEA